MKIKNKQIESLRAILLLMIVYYHYTYRFGEVFSIKTVDFFSLNLWGEIGVGCFFIISGYFIFPKGNHCIHPLKFLVKRILRLYPTYLVCITLIFLSITFFGLPGREVSFIEYLYNVILLNGYIGIDYVDGAHWYLTYLVLFTLIISFILFLEDKFKIDRKKSVVGWFMLNILLLVISNFITKTSTLYKSLGNQYIYYLLIGISLKETQGEKISNKNFIYMLLYFVSLGMIAIQNGLIVFMGVLIFNVILITSELKILQYPNSKILLKLGSISYVVYLIHQNIGYQILLGLTDYFGEYSIAFVPFAMLIIIGISVIIYKYFDLPLQKIITKRINND